MNNTGWLKGLRVTGDGTGIVPHAGVALLVMALLRALADPVPNRRRLALSPVGHEPAQAHPRLALPAGPYRRCPSGNSPRGNLAEPAGCGRIASYCRYRSGVGARGDRDDLRG